MAETELPDIDLEGRAVITTGADRGLGRAMRFGPAKKGPRLVLAAPVKDGLDAARLRRRMTSMKTYSALLLLAVLLSGCTAAYRSVSAVALGRQELFRGQNAEALESFEAAVRASPDSSFGVDRSEGVLSYLGRSQYLNGQYSQARQTLERDLARDEGNSLSRLYLGLTLIRLNDRQSGLHALTWGLSGIPYYINWAIDRADANDVRRFWDRHNQIHSAVAVALKMTERPDLNLNALLSLSERIALAWEQEPDFTRMSPEMNRPYNLTP